MNGVIVDDERIHQETWRRYCQKHNLHISEDEFTHNVFGHTEKDTFEYVLKRKISREELTHLSNERVDIAIELFTPKFGSTSGFLHFIEELQKNTILLAIATSSRRRYLNFIVDGLKIRNAFSVIVSSEDITQSKPHPEIYLKAAAQLSVIPTECVIFEDAVSGIKAARAAGMKVIGITTTHTSQELTLADKIISSFNEVSIEMLQDVIGH